ncbi:MAG: hypothetical protein KIT84_00505 [Labilithrix sp.]|nr:hypothetical protein [Labilithrix sp.]MCW5809464.1 hypothetical protein [Labilithrix sp.]
MGQLADALMGPLQRRLTEAGTVGQRDVAAMLNLLGEAELRSSLSEGSEAVAKLADFPVHAVWLRLPFDALLEHATAVGHAQVEALEAMSGNRSELLGMFESAAGFGIDLLLQTKVGLGGLGIGDTLSAFVGKKFREGRFKEAFGVFASRLQEFESLVEQAALQLDSDPELVQALAKTNKRNQVLGCGVILVIAALVAGLGWRGWKWATADETAPATSASARALPPPAPPSPLLGEWAGSSGQTLKAIEIADAIEFDIAQPGSWVAQGYVEGEMRFRLRSLDEEDGAYRVEEKVRPTAIKGVKFAPESAESCHVIRTEVDGAPLRARLSADRLVIESVRSAVPRGGFRWKGAAIIGCSMDKATESKGEIVLNRTRTSVGAAPRASSSGSNSP